MCDLVFQLLFILSVVLAATYEVQTDRYRILLQAMKHRHILALCASAFTVVYPIQMTYTSDTLQVTNFLSCLRHLMVSAQSSM